ncbi:chitinase-like protein 2 [Fagus crenata]
MEYKGSVLLTTILILVLVNCEDSSVKPSLGGPNKRVCVRCGTRIKRCCGGAISNYFQSSQFENIFSKRNSLEAHAVSFWNYQSFVTASAQYQSYGFGTTYWKLMGMKEVAAFLAHVASKTSCEFRVSVL